MGPTAPRRAHPSPTESSVSALRNSLCPQNPNRLSRTSRTNKNFRKSGSDERRSCRHGRREGARNGPVQLHVGGDRRCMTRKHQSSACSSPGGRSHPSRAGVNARNGSKTDNEAAALPYRFPLPPPKAACPLPAKPGRTRGLTTLERIRITDDGRRQARA